MKKTKVYLFLTLAIAFLALHSCVKEDSVYQPPVVPSESEYFDFTTTKNVQVNIDYGYDGYKVLIEVYAKNPLNQDFVMDSTIEPVFKAFTDDNSSFTGTITVPSNTDTLYLYSPSKGVNELHKMPVKNLVASYIYNASTKASANTRALSSVINVGNNINTISSSRKFYSLYNRYLAYGGDYYWQPSNLNVPNLYSVVSPDQVLTSESTFGQLLNRMNTALTKKDNSKFVSSEKIVNVSVLSQTAAGKPVTGARLDLVFVYSSGSYHSAIAYYYYKTGANLTGDQIKQLPKYFVLPRITSGNPSKAVKARLQFFGEDGNQPGVDLFPPGYTVGWMLVTDMFPSGGDFWSSDISKINKQILWAYDSRQVIFSNQSANLNNQPGCISLYDIKSQKIIVGFEDQAFNNLAYSDKSYEDVLFYIEADPVEAVLDPNKPEIPVVDNEVLVTERTKGTLAFEDIWPTGGDYDMNDVIVEYESAVTFNNNNQIKKIVDTFRPVNKSTSAIKKDAFGYVINGPVGTINMNLSKLHKVEETNQIIVFPDAISIAEQKEEFTVVREFASGVSKLTYKKDYNPFIVVNYEDGAKNRVEVHLPKYKPTSWANPNLNGTVDDAYYIRKDGSYPFAIDIPVVNLIPVTERLPIGSTNEYPKFTEWVKSSGKNNTDWYLSKK